MTNGKTEQGGTQSAAENQNSHDIVITNGPENTMQSVEDTTTDGPSSDGSNDEDQEPEEKERADSASVESDQDSNEDPETTPETEGSDEEPDEESSNEHSQNNNQEDTTMSDQTTDTANHTDNEQQEQTAEADAVAESSAPSTTVGTEGEEETEPETEEVEEQETTSKSETEEQTDKDSEAESEPEPEEDNSPTTTTTTKTGESFSAIVESDTLKDGLDSISVLVDECKIRLKEEGLSIRAVDPANVGMVDLTIDKRGFESYKPGGQMEVIGVNLSRLEDIVGMANKGDLIHLDLDVQTRKLNIHIDGLSYTLALIDPNSIRKEPDIPNLDLPAELVVKGSDLSRGLRAADMVSDHITFRVDELAEEFIIEAEGDTDDVDLTLTDDDLVDLTPGEADSLFSLDYLKDMNKAIPKSASVTAEIGTEFPVKLHYQMDDGWVQVTYMLAPRIQS